MLGMEEEERGCLVCSFIALNRAEFRHHMKDRHQININIRKLKNVPKTLQTREEDTNDGGDVVTPTVQIFFGKVIKEEEFSESEEMDNDFEEYDNEMDDEMDSEDGEDNRSDNYIEESDVSRDEPIDNAKDIGECLKVEVESDIEDGGHQFTCEACLQTFELAEHLVDHVKTAHADEKPESLDCQTCQKSFLTKQWLSRHIRKEHTTKPEQNIPEKPREKHQCHICKKELFFEKILKNHIEKEHDQEIYQCSHCPKSYITKSKFKLHQSIAHTSIKYNIDPSKQEMCEICSKIFCNAKRLRQHIQYVHEKSFKNKFCVPCNREFTPANYNHHMKAVHLEKAYTCEKCGKSFISKHCLAKHFNAVHEKIKPFICHLCAKGFPNPTNLQQHIDAIHRKLKPYLCKLCGKFYSLHTGLSVHLKNVHKIEKPNVTSADRVIK